MPEPTRPSSTRRRVLRVARRAAGRAARGVGLAAPGAAERPSPRPAGQAAARTPAQWRDELARVEGRLTGVEEELSRAQQARRDAESRLAAAEDRAAVLDREVTAWKARIQRPSFLREHHSWIDLGLHYRQDPSPARERIGELNRKLWVHAFATSHGVPVPRIHAVGDRPEDLRLDGLPDEFVVKSDGGTSSRAVIPLRRVGADEYEWIGHSPRRVLGVRDVIEHFQGARARGASYGPVFAEELLHGPDPDRLPDDVKVYVAYGQVLQVLLRRPTIVNGRAVAQARYVSERGRDLGDVAQWQDINPRIPVPASLPEMVEISRRLSLALPMPLCRVDLYETASGPVLGEITRTPGAPHLYRPDHDEYLGREWLKAEARLFEDMHHGRGGRPVWGDRAGLELLEDLPRFSDPTS